MRIHPVFYTFVLCLVPMYAQSQLASAPEPRTATISGIVTDTDEAVIPGATVTIDDPTTGDHFAGITTGDGSFTLNNLHPAVSYHLLVAAHGFGNWSSPAIVLQPGQQLDLTYIKLTVSVVETSVTAIQPEQLALEQVKNQEQQRLFGVIPNFYVSYDQRFVPLTTKLKYQLAFHSATDIVSIAGAGVLAGINQASDNKPDYVQGAKGYGQRFGAADAGTVTDIFIGGAVLPRCFIRTLATFIRAPVPGNHALSTPSLLHSSPRETTVDGNSTIPALAEIWLRAQSTMRTTQTKTVAWDSCLAVSRCPQAAASRTPSRRSYPPQSHKPLAQPELTSLTV